jgi:hypothetical protein
MSAIGCGVVIMEVILGLAILVAIGWGIAFCLGVVVMTQRAIGGWKPSRDTKASRLAMKWANWIVAEKAKLNAALSKDSKLNDEIAALRMMSKKQPAARIGLVEKASAERKAAASEAMRREWFADDDEELEEIHGYKKPPPPKFEPDKNVPKAKTGNSVWIEYCDARGTITERTVLDWERDRYELTGHCTLANGERTFKLDRVLTWGAWY